MKHLITAMTATNIVIQEQLKVLEEKFAELDKGIFSGDDVKGWLKTELIKSFEAQLIIFTCLSECEKIISDESLKDEDII